MKQLDGIDQNLSVQLKMYTETNYFEDSTLKLRTFVNPVYPCTQ